MMNRIVPFLAALLLAATMCQAQTGYDDNGWLPEKSNRLANDYYGLFTEAQLDSLETRLLFFNDSTSNQIVVMTTHGFGGRDIMSFAFEVGDKWGIGQAGLNNGVLIVVKPKDDTDGEVEIAPGKGLEGVLPDIFCKRIIEEKMIPFFRDSDYYGGISAALDIIEPVCAGEYSYEQYKEDNDGNPLIGLGITALIFGGMGWLLYREYKKNKGNGGGSHWSGWGDGGYSHWDRGGTSWSGGSSWGGGSSSHGGFGGFGGGSFGGGGAHGKW